MLLRNNCIIFCNTCMKIIFNMFIVPATCQHEIIWINCWLLLSSNLIIPKSANKNWQESLKGKLFCEFAYKWLHFHESSLICFYLFLPPIERKTSILNYFIRQQERTSQCQKHLDSFFNAQVGIKPFNSWIR